MQYSIRDTHIVLIYSHLDETTSTLAQQSIQEFLASGLLSNQSRVFTPYMWRIEHDGQVQVLGVNELFFDESCESTITAFDDSIVGIEYVWTKDKKSTKSNFWTGSNNQSSYSAFATLAALSSPNEHVQAFNFERAPDMRLGSDPWGFEDVPDLNLGSDPWSFEDNQNRFTQPHWPTQDTVSLRPTEPLNLSFEPAPMTGLGLVQWVRRDEEQDTQRISVEQVAERAMEEGHVHQVLENLSIPVPAPVPQSRAARRLQRRLDNRG